VTPRRITVVTGTRADYGLLRWLMAEIDGREALSLSIVATGTHFAEEFGSTYLAIVDDGFTIDERVDILGDDSPLGVARSAGVATAGIAEALDRLRPDLVVVLGDRFEILAATQAAMLLGIPVAHIAGGEVTEGAIDDSIRHAITKMARLHFTAAGDYTDRVIQLGEQPSTVFQVGAVGLDNLALLDLLDERALSGMLGFDVTRHPLAVCTHHPETLAGQSAAEALAPLLQALESRPNLTVVFTKSNADVGGREMNRLVDDFIAAHPTRMAAFASLGQLRYLSLLTIADVVIGNSSSGIVEAPSAGTPTVNIGDRQKGRLRAPSVIDVANDTVAITNAIGEALSDDAQSVARRRESPFGEPGSAVRIADVLETVDLEALRTKRFHDGGQQP
jgi:UDP-hydrolysing UDP-N-acetyl-D-glucosamine 2-epimerase